MKMSSHMQWQRNDNVLLHSSSLWMPLHKACMPKPQSTMAWLTVATLGGRPSFNQTTKRPKSAIKINNSTLLSIFPTTALSNLIVLVCAGLATDVLQRFAVALTCVKQHRQVLSSFRFLWQCNALEKSTVRQIWVGRVRTISSTTLQSHLSVYKLILSANAEAIAPANEDLGLFSCYAPDNLILGFHFTWGTFLNCVLSAQTPLFCLLHSEVSVTKDREERKGSTVCCGFHPAPFHFPDECNNFHCHFVSKTEICSIKHAMLKCCLGYELRELEPLLVSTASFTSHRHGEMKVTEEEHLNLYQPNWQWRAWKEKIAPYLFFSFFDQKIIGGRYLF